MNFILKKHLMLVVLVFIFVFMANITNAQAETRYEGNLPADVESKLQSCKGDTTMVYIGYDGATWVLNCDKEGNRWVSPRDKSSEFNE